MNEEIDDIFGRKISLTEARKKHLEEDHPEMKDSSSKIIEVWNVSQKLYTNLG